MFWLPETTVAPPEAAGAEEERRVRPDRAGAASRRLPDRAATPEKERFRTHEAASFRNGTGPAPDALQPFVARVKAGGETRTRWTRPANPFPGLRPFEADEEHLFFGRENRDRRSAAAAAQHRFLAVVGTSGSGKSSLVRSGLIPGAAKRADGRRPARAGASPLRPGEDPIGQLAAALDSPPACSAQAARACEHQPRADRSHAAPQPLGLVEAVQQAGLPPARTCWWSSISSRSCSASGEAGRRRALARGSRHVRQAAARSAGSRRTCRSTSC